MTKNIDAGDLRHRVTLYRLPPGQAADTVGQVPLGYQPVGTYYALVEPLSGSEARNAQQVKGTLRYRVTLRASSGPIHPSDRLAWGGHTLGVVAAVPDPFGILIEIDALELKVPQ